MTEPYIGEVRIFGFGFAPANWALCDGQPMSVAQNQALYSLLSNTFGGNENEFRLPDLRGRVPVHPGTLLSSEHFTVAQGEMGGVETTTLTIEQMATHNHAFGCAGFGLEANSAQPLDATLAMTAERPVYGPPNNLVEMNPASITPAGGNRPLNNMQQTIVFNFCIALDGAYPSRP